MRRLRRAIVLACLPFGAAFAGAGCEATAPPVEAPALVIEARNIEFTPKRVELPAGVAVHVTYRNGDQGVPHGVNVMPMRSGVEAPVLFEGEIITGPDERQFDLEPLQPGPYLFVCPVHPNMQIEAEAR